jgi:CubicO group peptidase (beta-lactamase class C family)
VDLAHEPGAHWAYSTGTSQILSGIVSRTIGSGREGVRAFAERELAQPLGIRSLVLEFDAAETPLGGASVWASARDWARLGLLYLRDGRFDGRRILPEGWVDFTRTPAPAENNGTFGAHFWLTGTPGAEQWQALAPGIEAFQMNGNAGQFVVLVPDRDLVIVRLGEMHASTWPELNVQLAELILTFPAHPGTPP